MSIVVAIIIFSAVVIFHEFGHFIFAKMNGVTVVEFSVGMGPRIISFEAGGTRYSLKVFPFGGSCAMLGEDEDMVKEGSFNSKNIWQRMSIVFAGPFFNFILAFFLSVILIHYTGVRVPDISIISEETPAYQVGLRQGDRIVKYNGTRIRMAKEIELENLINPSDGSEIEIEYLRDGKKNTVRYTPNKRYIIGVQYNKNATIEDFPEKSPAKNAGLMKEDKIVSIDGNMIASGIELTEYIQLHPWIDREYVIGVERNGEFMEFKMTPEVSKTDFKNKTEYNMGFSLSDEEKQGVLGTVKYSFWEMKFEVNMVLKSLGMLVTGNVSADQLSGPVGLVDEIGKVYDDNKQEGIWVTLMSMISLTILLSANLGVMNLLPIPALDGGRLFIYIIEVIRRKPMDREKEGMIHLVGFILLMILMVFLLVNDVRKLDFSGLIHFFKIAN